MSDLTLVYWVGGGVLGFVVGGIVVALLVRRLFLVLQALMADLETRVKSLAERLDRTQQRVRVLERFIDRDVILALHELQGGAALIAILRERLTDLRHLEE
jgi:hypothetical protein